MIILGDGVPGNGEPPGNGDPPGNGEPPPGDDPGVCPGGDVDGDLDGDCDVDLDDVNVILAARGAAASGADDERDRDGDGRITGLDARQLALLCDNTQCATQ